MQPRRYPLSIISGSPHKQETQAATVQESVLQEMLRFATVQCHASSELLPGL